MNEEMTQQQMMATAERFAHAAEALDRVPDRLDAQRANLTSSSTGKDAATYYERAFDLLSSGRAQMINGV